MKYLAKTKYSQMENYFVHKKSIVFMEEKIANMEKAFFRMEKVHF